MTGLAKEIINAYEQYRTYLMFIKHSDEIALPLEEILERDYDDREEALEFLAAMIDIRISNLNPLVQKKMVTFDKVMRKLSLLPEEEQKKILQEVDEGTEFSIDVIVNIAKLHDIKISGVRPADILP